MTDLDKALLKRLRQLEEAHAATKPPDEPYAMGDAREALLARRQNWFTADRHGPRIVQRPAHRAAVRRRDNDAARKRVARALDRLAAGGFVRLWGQGSNLTHVRLTPQGEASS